MAYRDALIREIELRGMTDRGESDERLTRHDQRAFTMNDVDHASADLSGDARAAPRLDRTGLRVCHGRLDYASFDRSDPNFDRIGRKERKSKYESG